VTATRLVVAQWWEVWAVEGKEKPYRLVRSSHYRTVDAVPNTGYYTRRHALLAVRGLWCAKLHRLVKVTRYRLVGK